MDLNFKFENNPVLGDKPLRFIVAPNAGFSTFWGVFMYKKLTREQLKEVLYYDPESGELSFGPYCLESGQPVRCETIASCKIKELKT